MKLLGTFLLLSGVASYAFANTHPTPEISPASAGSALTLISGALLMMRGRRKQ